MGSSKGSRRYRFGPRDLVLLLAVVATATGCDVPLAGGSDGGPDGSAGAAATREVVRQGGKLVFTPDGSTLLWADEQRDELILIRSPGSPRQTVKRVLLPGPPGQVLALPDRVLIAIRKPSMLLCMSLDDGSELSEKARLPLPADAWGLAAIGDGTGTAC